MVFHDPVRSELKIDKIGHRGVAVNENSCCCQRVVTRAYDGAFRSISIDECFCDHRYRVRYRQRKPDQSNDLLFNGTADGV